MKTVTIKREGSLLVTALNKKFTGYILTRVTRQDFGSEDCGEIYDRMLMLVKSGHVLPSKRDFAEDPTLSEDACAVVKKSTAYKSTKRIDECVQILDDYRKRRVAHSATRSITDIMKENGDVNDIFKEMERAIQKARIRDEVENRIVDFGAGADNDHAAVLLQERMERSLDSGVIGSGFDNFDSKSGGFGRGHVLILGASRGSGKTSLAVQVALNFYRRKDLNVGFVELEMSDGEAYERIMANVTGIDSLKIRRRDLDKRERSLLSSEHGKLHRYGKKRKCRFTTFPIARITAEEIDTRIGHMGYDVIIVDYLGLVDPDYKSAKATHEVKAEITRNLKAIAKRRDCLIVLIVQLTDDLRVKYSRAVEDHVDWFWGWRLDEKSREIGVVKVHQNKARHSGEFSFLLKFDLTTSRWVDYVGPDPFASEEDETKGTNVRKGSRFKTRYKSRAVTDDGYAHDSMSDL